MILPSGAEAQALAPLPVEALRLSADTSTALRRLGFKTIGALLDKPRAPFAARFPAELLRRIDQALGRLDEPLVPVVAPPVYHSLRYLIEPLITQEAVVALAGRLMQTLVHVLTRDDVGARSLRLSLYRVDGAVETVDIGLTLPTRNISHVTRLIDLKLEALSAMRDVGFGFEALSAMRDVGFGFEAVGLAVTSAEPLPARQNELIAEDAGATDRSERCAALIDTLRQRLGPQSVRRFAAVASHIPERAEALLPVTGEAIRPPPERGRSASVARRVGVSESQNDPSPPARPLLLLPHAEPTEVTALVPDGPPRRFRWRGVTYEVAGAQGPERIAAEWWLTRTHHFSAHSREGGNPALDEVEKLGPRLRGDERQHALTRDYYLVEDADGHRFWLYREGLYERETVSARWFVHGLFG